MLVIIIITNIINIIIVCALERRRMISSTNSIFDLIVICVCPQQQQPPPPTQQPLSFCYPLVRGWLIWYRPMTDWLIDSECHADPLIGRSTVSLPHTTQCLLWTYRTPHPIPPHFPVPYLIGVHVLAWLELMCARWSLNNWQCLLNYYAHPHTIYTHYSSVIRFNLRVELIINYALNPWLLRSVWIVALVSRGLLR